MSNKKATMAQGRDILEIFEDLPSERLQGIGKALLHLVREYLAGEQMKPVNLRVLSQVLGVSLLAEDVWITVDWQETPPRVASGFAVMSGQVKHHRTMLMRLRPTDVGLSNDDHPISVIDLATAWGYKRVPRRALETLLRNPPLVRVRYPGDAMVLLDDGHYSYLRVGRDGSIRAVDEMDVTDPNFATTWSVIVAC